MFQPPRYSCSRAHTSACRGFTFAEILISLVILGILLGGLLSLFSLSVECNDNSREILIAMAQVQGRMEEIRSVPYTDIAAFDGTIFPLRGLDGDGYITVSNPLGANVTNVNIAACWSGSRGGRPYGNVVGRSCGNSPVNVNVLIALR